MTAASRPFAAAVWMLGSIGGFSALAISGRAIGSALDTFEMMFYRSLIGIVLVVAVTAAVGRTGEISAKRIEMHLLRNILHFAGQNLWLAALALIPLAQLFALEFSYPILVALSAPLFLGERLGPTKVLAAILGFVGILVVARPFGVAGLSPGLGLALLCAVGFAGAAIVTKRLTLFASLPCILFWLTVMQAVLGLICAGWDGQIALPPEPVLPWVVLLGVAGLVAQLCLTKALSLAPATVVTPVDFLRLPLIAVIGALFYEEPLNLWVLLGGAIIFFANWINLTAEGR